MEEKETLPMTDTTKTTKKTLRSESDLIAAGYRRHSGTSKIDGKTKVNSLWSKFDPNSGKFYLASTDGTDTVLNAHEVSVMVGQLATDKAFIAA